LLMFGKLVVRDGLSTLEYDDVMVYPQGLSRPSPTRDVPVELASDYVEASRVLPYSAKASAALTRRCLQALLENYAKVKHGDLSAEIQEVLDTGGLPSHIAEAIDGIRNVGNFAAHPLKSTQSGAIVDVEDGEAEWLLDTLDSLFDFYFVQPAATKRKKDALNAKLKSLGKPPMK